MNVGDGACSACHGKGEKDQRPCEACAGTGVCQSCGGTGVIED